MPVSRASSLLLVVALVACGGSDAPPQPIAFPHTIHAGDNEIHCEYCHFSASRSVDAGIPGLNVCMGCHYPSGVPLVGADKPEVQKILSYWQAGQPVPWVRVYDLPDHAHFPHMMHVNAEVECQECHGPVEEMEEVYQYTSLRMGWCLDCHMENDVRRDCFVCHY